MMTVLLVTAALAGQSPCDDRALPDGALMVGFEQADFGVFRRACPRSEIALGGGGRAIIEQENFYADLRGNARLDVSSQPFDALELSLSLEPVFAEQVIQSFRASHVGLGDTSVSALLLAFTQDSFALSVLARASLPTAFGYYKNASPLGLDAGVLMLLKPVDAVRLHAGLLGMSGFAVTKADPDPRGAVAGNFGFDLVLFDWLALVADLNAQAMERAPLDRLTLGGGARVAVGDLGFELGVAVPVAGADRHLAAALLRASWRFW